MKPDNIKYFIGCNVPVFVCNFRCRYCYLGHHEHAYEGGIKPFAQSPDYIADYFSVERMQGLCYFNFCAFGETFLHPELIELVSKLTEQGHFVDIITNGTISKNIDKLIETLNGFQRKRLLIKFSFHYLELKERDVMSIFVENVNKVKEAGISYSIEITPHDELIPYIDEIKEFSLKNFGAWPHITVARNEATDEIELLTKLSREEYIKTWSVFDSGMFDFKIDIFNKKRCEFCYAGLWSLQLNLATGNYTQCYAGDVLGNIQDKKLHLRAIGKCRQPHCFNGHAFLTYGLIPELDTPAYAVMRERVKNDGGQWLQTEAKAFFSTKLVDANTTYTEEEKRKALKKGKYYKINSVYQRIKNKLISKI